MMIARMLSVAVLGVWLAGPAVADESQFQADRVSLDTVVARVDIVTEERADFSVLIEPGSGEIEQPQARVTRGTLRIEGARGYRVQNCRTRNDQSEIRVSSGEYISTNAMPKVVIRAPLGANVLIEQSTIFGAFGDLGEAEISVDGCSRVSVASLSGPSEITLNGSGDLEVGSAVRTELTINGSGDIAVGDMRGDLEAQVNGSGDIAVTDFQGELELSVHGSGDISVAGGRATGFEAEIYGSGDIRFAGVAVDPDVSIYGSGDVRIAALEGGLNSSSAGSGNLRIGN